MDKNQQQEQVPTATTKPKSTAKANTASEEDELSELLDSKNFRSFSPFFGHAKDATDTLGDITTHTFENANGDNANLADVSREDYVYRSSPLVLARASAVVDSASRQCDYLQAHDLLPDVDDAALVGTEREILSQNYQTVLSRMKVTGPKRSILVLAVLGQFLDVVQYLYRCGHDLDKVDDDGRTALHYAAMYGYDGAIRALCVRGADVNAKDKQQYTAFSYAVKLKHEKCVNLLLAYGAQMTQKGVGVGTRNTPPRIRTKRRFTAVQSILRLTRAKAEVTATSPFEVENDAEEQNKDWYWLVNFPIVKKIPAGTTFRLSFNVNGLQNPNAAQFLPVLDLHVMAWRPRKQQQNTILGNTKKQIWRSTLPHIYPYYNEDLAFVASSSSKNRIDFGSKLDFLSYTHMRGQALIRPHSHPSAFSAHNDTTASSPGQVCMQGTVEWGEVHVENPNAGAESGEVVLQFQLSICVRPIDWIQIVACGFTCDSGSLNVRSTVRMTHSPDEETDMECKMCVCVCVCVCGFMSGGSNGLVLI